MSEQEYTIHIHHWERFQHYKDRNPNWIKIYTELHHDENYRKLTGHQRAVLVGLWLEYASAHRQLTLTTRSLTHRLGLRVMSRDLEALNHAGWIKLLLAGRYQSASTHALARSTYVLRESSANASAIASYEGQRQAGRNEIAESEQDPWN